MKGLTGLFDMLASKSDADASDLIGNLANKMKEKMAETSAPRPSARYGEKTLEEVPKDEGKAKNIVSPDYKQLEVGARPYVSPKGASFGKSWGDVMPKEPNQFNSHMPYNKYFREIFKAVFPEYEITEEKGRYSRPATIFTFRKDGRRALVVEVISESTDVYRLRNECRRMGTQYLRYYHDHHGWWNTREYVIERTGAALANSRI